MSNRHLKIPPLTMRVERQRCDLWCVVNSEYLQHESNYSRPVKSWWRWHQTKYHCNLKLPLSYLVEQVLDKIKRRFPEKITRRRNFFGQHRTWPVSLIHKLAFLDMACCSQAEQSSRTLWTIQRTFLKLFRTFSVMESRVPFSKYLAPYVAWILQRKTHNIQFWILSSLLSTKN